VKRYVASFKVRPVVIAAVVVAALAGIGAVVYFGRGSGVSSGASPPVEDLSGSVVATTGSPPVGRGAACSVAIKPSTSSRYNCRVRVACGDRALYGATSTTGFSHCNVAPGPDGRAAVSALGAGDTTPTGDPGIDLHTATAEVILTDRRPAIPWSMTIHLDPSSQ
jgi:hypothetical protein